MVNFQTIKFNRDNIEIVDTFVSVKKLCQNIGITGINDQYKKIKADKSYESKIIKMDINHIEQEVVVIPVSKINGWLFSISPSRITNESVKEKLIEYKNECFDVLNNYFNKGIAVNEKFHQRQILGYKSQIAQHNNKIEHLKNCLEQQSIEYERKLALPHFSKDEKIDILLKSSNELISNKNLDRCSFISALQNQLKFYSTYVTAVKTGGTKLEQFSINQIEDYKKRTVTAEINQQETKEQYNDLIKKVKSFIDASNQISLLKPI